MRWGHTALYAPFDFAVLRSGRAAAIVRAIAEAHGGRVELRSAPGRGSTFILDLPTEPPEELDAP